jgi:hypothetical protein
MSRLVSALTVLIAAAATGIAWFQSHSWWMTTLAGLICALIGFGKKVWSKLEPQWTDRVAGAVDRYVTTWFAGYPKRYAEHLYYKHRTFDVKGFSTQGKFATGA